jgi:hypothetical protein
MRAQSFCFIFSNALRLSAFSAAMLYAKLLRSVLFSNALSLLAFS